MSYDLERFVSAQDGGTYDQALAELRAGRKTSHWMWFVFPQIAGLGSSPMTQKYAIAGADEARAYLAHPVLGPRLAEASRAALESGTTDPDVLLGGIDAMKLRSSMTLFQAVSDDDAQALFTDVLETFYGGEPDPETLNRL